MQKYFQKYHNEEETKVMNEEHEEDSQKDFYFFTFFAVSHWTLWRSQNAKKKFHFQCDDDIAITHSSFARLKMWWIEWLGSTVN